MTPESRQLPASDREQGKELQTFHHFSLLPAELRIYIWELAKPQPRVVEIRHHSSLRSKENGGTGQSEEIRSLTRTPAILHVCRESRRVAAEELLYQRAFGRGQAYVWVNFEVDMISIGQLAAGWIRPEEQELVRRLRIEGEYDEFFFHFASRWMQPYRNLEELHIVCQEGVWRWMEAAEEVVLVTENVFFIDESSDGTVMYSRREMLEESPAVPFPEYSDSEYRWKLDKRIKGGMDEVPDELWDTLN